MRRLLFPYLVLWVLGAVVLRWAVVPAEQCPAVTPAEIHRSAVAAGDWLAANQHSNGKFTYRYDRDTDAVGPGYNIVRHAGASMSLYQLAGAGGEPRFLLPADRSLTFLTEGALLRHRDWAAVAPPGQKASLGATGLMLAALGTRRDATGDTSRDALMRQLGRFIVGQQQEDGSMLSRWDRVSEEPVPGGYSVFATGEAVWGLAMLHRMFPTQGWGGYATRTMDYIAEGRRERNEGQVARLPDHWAAYALEEMGRTDLIDEELAEFAARLAGYFALRLRVEAQRTGAPSNVVVRGFPGPPSGVGTAGEGLAALYRLAANDIRLMDMRDDMGARLTCMAGLMTVRQVSGAEAKVSPSPELSQGAWFYRSFTQVDDQQHMLSAMIGAEGVAGGAK